MKINSQEIRAQDGSTLIFQNDPRVTKFGKFLRKFSLDELPQLINIILGDMSLVGPRPDQVDQIKYYSKNDLLKLEVKPGLTGLAQISGRNQIGWTRRKELDIKYVTTQTIFLDFKILIKTIPYILKQEDIFNNE